MVVTFPDAEQLVIGHLGDVLDAYVCATLPVPEEFEELLPIVQVTRIGGTWAARKRLDNPRLDLDVYHLSRPQAHDLLAEVRGQVEAMTGLTRDGGVVTRTDEETGPRLIPDPNPGVVRMGYTASLHVRPA